MSRTRQNLRWKRKKPTLENPKTYVGNSRFLGWVWRRQMAALPIAQRQHCRSCKGSAAIPRSPCACQRAVRFGATAYASLGYVGLRPRSGCSHCRSGDLRVHAPARRILIRLRGAVLRNSPRPASVRSAAAPILTALGTSGTGKRFSVLVAPYAKSRRRSRRLRR